MSWAELSLWARVEGLTRDAVTEALWTHRSLVKLWTARRTLHLLPAAELKVWLPCRPPRDCARSPAGSCTRAVPPRPGSSGAGGWVIGMARREPRIDPSHVRRVYRQQGWVSPVILVNGDRQALGQGCRQLAITSHGRKGSPHAFSRRRRLCPNSSLPLMRTQPCLSSSK